MTQTSAVNTEEISKGTASTQTVMPRSNVSFRKAYEPRHKIQYYEDEEDEGENLSEDPELELLNLEKKLKSKSKLTRQKSQCQQRIDIVIEDESSDVIAIETIPTESRRRPRSRKDSDSDYEEIHEEPKVIKPRPKPPSKENGAAYNSWHDLDFPDQKVELPRNYFTEGPTPWSNFQDLILGRRFLNARFSPTQPRPQQFQPLHHQAHARHVTWSEPQVKIVNDLVREANGLLDMFDQVAMLLGPDIKLHNVSGIKIKK